MSVREQFQKYMVLFDQRTLRERALVLISLLIVLAFVWNAVILEPMMRKRKTVRAETVGIESEIDQLRAEADLVRHLATADPDQESRRQISQLRVVVAELDRTLEARLVNLLSPQEMPRLLRDMLKEVEGLKLVSLENLPPREMLTANADEEPPPGLYQHTLQLELEGPYLSLLPYLKKLEGLSQQLFWDALSVETKKYPVMRVRLQVHTLSLSEDLIGV